MTQMSIARVGLNWYGKCVSGSTCAKPLPGNGTVQPKQKMDLILIYLCTSAGCQTTSCQLHIVWQRPPQAGIRICIRTRRLNCTRKTCKLLCRGAAPLAADTAPALPLDGDTRRFNNTRKEHRWRSYQNFNHAKYMQK